MRAKSIFVLAKAGKLSDNHPNISDLDSNGLAAIHYAAIDGHEVAVSNLIESGVDVELLTKENETPFDVAIEAGHFSVANLLLNKGKLVEPRPNGYNALDYPAMTGNVEAANYLLSVGADINGSSGVRPPIVWAVQEDQFEMVELLVSRGADILLVGDIEVDTNTALSLAAGDGNKKMIRLMINILKKSANIDAEKISEAVELGTAYGHEDCVELIRQLEM